MRSLAANDFILARELGVTHDAADRAVAMLSLAFPEESRDELSRLSLGRRTARLLDVRERLFGPELHGFAECPQCGTALELAMDADALRSERPVHSAAELELDADGFRIHFRLLDSRDLKAASRCDGVESARSLLVQRCVLGARRGDESIDAAELPPPVIDRLAQQLDECDPRAETLVALTCPACAFEWQLAFDVASFLHTEISARGRRLLSEVHALAREYGWREADILAMSDVRRREYLELIGND